MRNFAFALQGSLLSVIVALAPGAIAQQTTPERDHRVAVHEEEDGTIVATDLTGTYTFFDWEAYFASAFFSNNFMRCGEEFLPATPDKGTYGSTSDCTYTSTNPSAEYDPSVVKFRIPCVVHVIEHSNGNGALSDNMVRSQIDILNEDFLALAGTNGAPGTDCQVEYYLATEDPDGNPTTGITHTVNNNWYNDSGNYKAQLHWDTHRYFNMYTNTASGYLGYAYIPQQGGIVGNSIDGIVCHWTAFGRNSVGGPPYDQGRTATHEAGHYLGLFHTFDNGCGSNSCYNTGDLICDTSKESGPVFGCPGNSSSCGSQDPFHNYMDYSDDLCMFEFSPEQARRVRCTIEYWRPDLFETGGGNTLIFSDGFESGDYAGGGWNPANGRCKIHAKSALNGAWGARPKKTTKFSKTLSTLAFTNVEIHYNAKLTTNYPAGKSLRLQYWDGSGWTTVDTVTSTSWVSRQVTLPAAAAGDPSFTFRFKTNSKLKKSWASIDDVRVYGS